MRSIKQGSPAAGLPDVAWVAVEANVPGTRIGIVKRGELGYWVSDYDAPEYSIEEVRSIVERANARLGVTKAQAEAMKAGSMFGWSIPAADPLTYATLDGGSAQ